MRSKPHIEATKARLRRIGRNPFEQFVADAFENDIWETETTKQSGDGGVDVIATQSGFPQCEPLKVFIQARRYTASQVQPHTVTRCLQKIQRNYDMPDRVLIVSTGECTDQARRTASRLNVGVIDGGDLSRYLIANDKIDILEKYI